MQRRHSGNPAVSTLPVTVTCDGTPTNSSAANRKMDPPSECSPNGYHHRKSPTSFHRKLVNSNSSSQSMSSFRKGAGATTPLQKVAVVLLMAVMFFAGQHVNKNQMQSQVATVVEERDRLESNERRLLHELDEAHQKQVDSTEEEHELQQAIDQLQEEKSELQALLDAQIDTIRKKSHQEDSHEVPNPTREEVKSLKASIQKISREQAIEHFGSGPHYVEFEVALPKASDKSTMEPAYFTLEMASLSHMPTTVNMFLRAAKKGLWDTGHFAQNAHHVVMGEPADMGKFIREGVAHLPFREYSPNVPHEPYTIGLAGNPPGPAFYINKIDNTNSHGANAATGSEGEPCFGRVIIGKETIDRMVQQPNQEQHENAFVDPIQIKAARIIGLHEAHGGEEFFKMHASTDPSSDE